MAFKGGVVLGPVSLNATGSATTNIAGTSNSGTVSIGNGSSAAVTIGCGTAGISVGATANAHSSTFGSTNSTSSTTVQSGSGALNVTSTNGALTINSGTGTLSISNDATNATVNIATGSANKTVSLGSTTTGSTLTLNAASSATYTGPNFTSSTSQVGAYKIFGWQNSDNTNSGSHSLIRSQSGGTSGGNPAFCVAEGSSRAYAWGIDPSDSAALKETTAAADSTIPGSGTLLRRMTSGGAQTLPLQPAFLAYLGTAVANATGNGTTYTLGALTTALTEVFDQNNNFSPGNGAGTGASFTAPITGRYLLQFQLGFTGVTIGTSYTINIITSNRTYQMAFVKSAGASRYTMSVIADMDAADTATYTAVGGGEAADTQTIAGGSTIVTFVSGSLIC